MLKNLKNIVVVSLSTVGSRVLGLGRDILIFAALGASAWNDAFIIAFTLPNLFRRLLGEGALTSAMVPIFSDVLQRAGRSEAFAFFNQVLLRLLMILSALALSGMVLFGLLARSGMLSDRWSIGAELAVLLLPYMIFICLAAIVCAGLNLLGRFAVAASTPILLNCSMISALAVGMWLSDDQAQIVYWLCGGVLLGGLLQLLLPAWDLARQGWRPCVESRVSAEMSELWGLFVPGLMGAAILQVNILVSRLLAYSFDESAVSVLYLASRLMELPLGIFTVAVATVFFPLLARAVSDHDDHGFAVALTQGMRLVVGISLPAGVGLLVLGEPILELLFQWGSFSTQNVAQTIPLIAIYGLGLPFYSAATFATRGLHACKDMKTPVRVAALCLLVNLISGIVLMQFYGACGLAAANVLAAIVQSICLWRALSTHRSDVGFSQLRGAFVRVLCAGVAMGVFCLLGRALVDSFELVDKFNAAVIVGLFVPGGVTVYFGLLYFLKFEELDALVRMLRRMIPKRTAR
jgi:putative peptidoglycan lipid II flippase